MQRRRANREKRIADALVQADKNTIETMFRFVWENVAIFKLDSRVGQVERLREAGVLKWIQGEEGLIRSARLDDYARRILETWSGEEVEGRKIDSVAPSEPARAALEEHQAGIKAKLLSTASLPLE